MVPPAAAFDNRYAPRYASRYIHKRGMFSHSSQKAQASSDNGGLLTGSDEGRKPRKVDIAYEEIRRQIVMLELEPGAAIDERQLINRLAIGRTPVREAIQRLIHEGMITHTPRRGSWVSPLSFTELQNMIEARRMLEIECARRAAERISHDRLQQMRQEVERTGPEIRAGAASVSVNVDQFFHTEIARATGNRYLLRMTEQLQHELMRYWHVSALQVGELDIIVRHHLTILDAISTRNPDAAERVMGEHVTLFRERLSALITGSQLSTASVSASVGRHEC
jgi:GntR family transcriptional regulator, rspAB operon transcriptional repressor